MKLNALAVIGYALVIFTLVGTIIQRRRNR